MSRMGGELMWMMGCRDVELRKHRAEYDAVNWMRGFGEHGDSFVTMNNEIAVYAKNSMNG